MVLRFGREFSLRGQKQGVADVAGGAALAQQLGADLKKKKTDIVQMIDK